MSGIEKRAGLAGDRVDGPGNGAAVYMDVKNGHKNADACHPGRLNILRRRVVRDINYLAVSGRDNDQGGDFRWIAGRISEKEVKILPRLFLLKMDLM